VTRQLTESKLFCQNYLSDFHLQFFARLEEAPSTSHYRPHSSRPPTWQRGYTFFATSCNQEAGGSSVGVPISRPGFFPHHWIMPTPSNPQTVLVFLKIYGGLEPSRNRVTVPARQATFAGGIGSLESIPGLHKSLKIRALVSHSI
jgi:hypothetical protein